MRTAEDILNQWLAGVNAGDADGVLALYSADAILLPTFSPDIRRGEDAIRAYFGTLSQQGEVQVSVREATLAVQALGSALFCLSGEYDWRFGSGDEPRREATRFSFVIDCAAPRPILHHHSSRTPTTP